MVVSSLNTYHADFHIHVGRALGLPVKIAAGSHLTLENLLRQSLYVKGLDVITIIDGVCDHVLVELENLVSQGELVPVSGGGLMYHDRLLVLLGAEIELSGPTGRAAHVGCWFPGLDSATDFNRWLKTVQKNTSLSSQRARTPVDDLMREVHDRDGLFVIHHAFTPFKGILGNAVDRLSDFLDVTKVDALELGLSADTAMADTLTQLANITFLTNSDAHGLKTIAREYNQIQMLEPTFDEVRKVLLRQSGRQVLLNVGLHPAHGKYFRTRCRTCDQMVTDAGMCACSTAKAHVRGVMDRVIALSDTDGPVHPVHRPPYLHHVPLLDIPGLGPRAYQTLLDAYGTELSLRSQAKEAELFDLVGESLGKRIAATLRGDVVWVEGGAGSYGKLLM